MRRLTIVVPVLDEAAIITGALQALAPFRARGAEVIVVDSGSSDGTPDLAAPLADRVVAAPRGRGAPRAGSICASPVGIRFWPSSPA
jgi:glycosyltransferase involved in cell wall biosynthesis